MRPPRQRLNLFILAGEPSGDRIGADLIRRLNARTALTLSGVGGQEMQAEGLQSIFPMSDLAVMGISDVLLRLPLLLWRVEQTARAIRLAAPDVAVLIDSQDFSKLVAKRLRQGGYRGKLVLYVAPSVWARAPQRAAKLKPLFEEVLAVLPFEPAVMAQLGGPPTHYVGHPALNESYVRSAVDRGPLVLLPGSREGELRRHLPLFRQMLEQLGTNRAIEGVIIPTLPSLKARIERDTQGWSTPVQVVADRGARRALYERAVMAVAVSGTVTLELALAQVPMVVSYVLDAPQARIFEKLGRPAVSLPNIVLASAAVPELVQATADPKALVQAVQHLLDNKKARQDQIEAFGALSQLMEEGEEGFPRQDPADRVLANLT